MKTPYDSCPSAHSMDTDWFALDEKGNVGVFSTGETGALPHRAFQDSEQTGELATDIAAALIAPRAKELRWQKKSEDAYEVALIAAKKPVFGAQVKAGVLRLVSKEPLALYAPIDELDDEELLEELVAHEDCLGFLTHDGLAAAAGLARYDGGNYEAAGEYGRLSAPKGAPALPPKLKKKLAGLTLPVDFTKAKVIQLWKYVDEDDVSIWESGVPYDGGATAAREAAKALRRFEFVGGGSSKFWEVHVEGDTLHVRFGRIGTEGQLQLKKVSDAAAAVEEAEKLIREKVNKGYQATGGAPAPGAEPVPSLGWQAMDRASFKALTHLDPGKRPVWQREERREDITITHALLDLGPEDASEALLAKLGLETDREALPSFSSREPVPLPDGTMSDSYGQAVGGLESEKKGKVVTLRWGLVVNSSESTWLAVGIASGAYREEFEAFAARDRRRQAEHTITAAIKRDDARVVMTTLRAAALDASDHLDEARDAKAWRVFEALVARLPRKDQQRARDGLIAYLDWKEALEHGADLDFYADSYSGTLLSKAKDVREVRALVAAGADPDAPLGDDGTAIHHLEAPALIVALVEAGASLEALDGQKRTPLKRWLERLTFATPSAEDLSAAKAMIAAGPRPSKDLLTFLASWGKKPHLVAAAKELQAAIAKR